MPGVDSRDAGGRATQEQLPRGAAWMPYIGRQHKEVLLANPQINEQRKEPEGRDSWASFFWLLFFDVKKSN